MCAWMKDSFDLHIHGCILMHCAREGFWDKKKQLRFSCFVERLSFSTLNIVAVVTVRHFTKSCKFVKEISCCSAEVERFLLSR